MNLSFKYKKIPLIACAATVMALFLTATAAPAMTARADTENQECVYLSGSNEESQNYTVRSSTVTSYLTTTQDGFMRVEGSVSGQGNVVVYYDDAFNLIERKVLPDELPLFGAFYETDSNYYLVTGQNNTEENDETEVYRLTKYDKSWNRIGACSLYGANTYAPFASGCCRIDHTGKYMVIRTCHQMYDIGDGLHHQANVTILADTESMEFTDSYYDVMNVNYGYVSHSFNQFVQLQDNKIVSVDHGDAYPRSICLMQYPTDVTTGSFATYRVVSTDVLALKGEIGANATGASVGGFEISDSSYLIAGNTIPQEEDATSSTRNVFVASVDQSSLTVTMNYLTDFTEGTSPSTPHMVAVDGHGYLVLWSLSGNVYYAFIDGTGQKTSEIYSLEGSLSECKPIVADGNVIWYTWDSTEEKLYKIPVDSPAEPQIITKTYGHDFVWQDTTDGTATFTCSKCGEVQTGQVPTLYTVYWKKSDSEESTYYSAIPSDLRKGDTLLTVISEYYDSADADHYYNEFTYESSDPENCVADAERERIELKDAGTFKVTIYPTYNPDLKKTYTLTVKKPLISVSLSTDKESPVQYGDSVVLTAKPNGGISTLNYRFFAVHNPGTDSEWSELLQNSSESTCTWKPEKIEDYSLYVDVTDSDDSDHIVISESLPFTVKAADVTVSDWGDYEGDLNLTYGTKLSEHGGNLPTVTAVNTGETVEGSFTFERAEELLPAGDHEIGWTFTSGSDQYEELSGTKTVHVAKAVPEVSDPSCEPATYHPDLTLAKIPFSDTYTSVSGKWMWADETAALGVPGGTYDCLFVPENENYETVSRTADVVISKAVPVIRSVEASGELTYGESLSAISLQGTVNYSKDDDTEVAGEFRWTDPDQKPGVADSGVTGFAAVFCPEDSGNYTQVDCSVKVTVLPAEYPPVMPPETASVPYTVSALTASAAEKILADCAGWEFTDEDAFERQLTVGQAESFTVEYTAEGKENYSHLKETISIVRSECEHDGETYTKDAKDATCTEAGATGDVYCSICNEKIKSSTEIPALGHKWDEGVQTVTATCVTSGETTYTCERCGEKKVVIGEKDPDNHEHSMEEPCTPASFDSDGKTGRTICTDCGAVIAESEVIPAVTAVELSDTSYVYDGKAKEPHVLVMTGELVLDYGIDYTVTYSDNINVGTASVVITGIGKYSGSTVRNFTILPAASKKVTIVNVASGIKVKWLKVEGATSYKVYRDGKQIKTTSKLEITDTEVKYKSGTKYTYKVVATAKNVGESPKARTATYYRLMPVGITSVKNTAAGKMTVTYGSNKQSSGYVVRFGLKKDMSDAKVITVKGAGTLSRTFSGLKKGKTYNVQVRTYLLDNGVRYYSGYCTTKSVKITK